MAASDRIAVLLGQFAEAKNALASIAAAYERFATNDMKGLGRREVTASRLCDILERSYTCFETVFLRISRFFENDFAKGRWRQDLLDKMILDVPGVRPRVMRQRR